MNYGQSYQVKSQENLSDDMALIALENSLNRLAKSNLVAQNKANKIIRENEKYSELLLKLKKSKKELYKKVVSLVVSIAATGAILTGGVVLPYKIASSKPGAYTETKTYSMVEPVQTEEGYNKNYTEDKDYLKVYGTFDETGTRLITTYDVTSYNLDGPSDAMSLDISNIKPIDIVMDEKSDESKPEETREYIKEKYESALSGTDRLWLPFIYTAELGILVSSPFISGFIEDNSKNKKTKKKRIKGVFSHISDVKAKLKECEGISKEADEVIKEMLEDIDVTISYLEGNKLYKERFIELFNKYSYLYSDLTTVYEKYRKANDSLENDTTLSLIKEIKSSLN